MLPQQPRSAPLAGNCAPRGPAPPGKRPGTGIWSKPPAKASGPSARKASLATRIREILGCGIDQIAGHQLDEFLFPEDRAVERVRLVNRRGGGREQFDRRLRRPDGSEVWTLATSIPFRTRDGEDFAGLTLMNDI